MGGREGERAGRESGEYLTPSSKLSWKKFKFHFLFPLNYQCIVSNAPAQKRVITFTKKWEREREERRRERRKGGRERGKMRENRLLLFDNLLFSADFSF